MSGSASNLLFPDLRGAAQQAARQLVLERRGGIIRHEMQNRFGADVFRVKVRSHADVGAQAAHTFRIFWRAAERISHGVGRFGSSASGELWIGARP